LVVASCELVCECVSPADSMKGFDISAGEQTSTRFSLRRVCELQMMSVGEQSIPTREQKR